MDEYSGSAPDSGEVEAQLSEIRRSLRTRMDGAVAESMRAGGLSYRYNWGWTRGFIIELANRHRPSAALCRALRESRVREMSILSTLLYPKECRLTDEELQAYLSMAANVELQEQVAFNLFAHHAEARAWAAGCVASGADAPGQLYTALLTLSGYLRLHPAEVADFFRDRDALLRRILQIYCDEKAEASVRRAAFGLLERLSSPAAAREQLAPLILEQIESGRATETVTEDLRFLYDPAQ